MNPNSNIDDQRQYAKDVLLHTEDEDAKALAQLVIELDDFITRGGELPDSWQPTRRSSSQETAVDVATFKATKAGTVTTKYNPITVPPEVAAAIINTRKVAIGILADGYKRSTAKRGIELAKSVIAGSTEEELEEAKAVPDVVETPADDVPLPELVFTVDTEDISVPVDIMQPISVARDAALVKRKSKLARQQRFEECARIELGLLDEWVIKTGNGAFIAPESIIANLDIRVGHRLFLGLKAPKLDVPQNPNGQITRLVFVIDGEDISVPVDNETTLFRARGRALVKSEHTGRPQGEWEIRKQNGVAVDPDDSVDDLGVDNTRLFLSLRAGAGG